MRILALSAVGILGVAAACAWGGSSAAPAALSAAVTVAGGSAGLAHSTLGIAGGTLGNGADSLTRAPSGLTVPVPMPMADEVIVRKSERRLYLMRHGQVLRSYRVALGLDPDGPKQRAGDFRTPEGHYLLTRRNPRSDYFLAIQVSYPNATDLARAHREHVDPGGQIMVHGLPNALSHKPSYYASSDWTDGCIALSDSDMLEVWLMTRDNTPIVILP